jgi:hypothetical protein
MSELKRCPFCGKTVTEKEFFSGDGFPVGCLCIWETTTGTDAMSRWQTRPIEDELETETARLREALAKVCDYVEAYINGVEVGETGDKQYVYPGDEETYTGIADIVQTALKPLEAS